MTKRLEQAIKKIRELPDADQEDAADLLLMLAARATAREKLDEPTRAAIHEGIAQARRGEFASDEEIAAIFDFNSRDE